MNTISQKKHRDKFKNLCKLYDSKHVLQCYELVLTIEIIKQDLIERGRDLQKYIKEYIEKLKLKDTDPKVVDLIERVWTKNYTRT